MQAKPPKPRKCKSCSVEFTPQRMGQAVCSPVCALDLVRKGKDKTEAIKAKVERKADKAKRERLKTRSDWIKDAQREFNAYIRARDKAAGHPCISSGRPLDWSGNAVDAGHFRSVGAAPHLRFDERNCHAQSKHDNQYKSGNVSEYRIGLIERIGLEAVEALESDQTSKNYTIDDLKAIIKTYRQKRKDLETS